MILIDRMLSARHVEDRPIRVAMVGAGFMGRGIALQMLQSVKGMRLVAIANRHVAAAERAYREAGAENVRHVDSIAQLDDAIERGEYSITADPTLVCRSTQVDVLLEVTGTVDFAAVVTLEAMANGKHVVMMNAELDGTLGPVLQIYARRAGVILTNADGDQPGVIMNLFRFVRGIGMKPVLCGNIKGLHDPYRNPATQAGFAYRWGQSPTMVTAFADGTKISFEQAIVANATGMRVIKRGMLGPTVPAGTPVTESARWYPEEAMLEGPGLVDYVVGASPSPGVFVLGTQDHPRQQHYLNLYKLGEGPFYCFYTPYHLCHFEVPNTIARAVDFRDAAVAPIAGPVVEVVATAKVDLRAGQILDGIGGFLTYGQCENADVAWGQKLLPMGLAEGCRLTRDISRDQVLTYEDVAVPQGRLSDALRREQDVHFMGTPNADADASAGAGH